MAEEILSSNQVFGSIRGRIHEIQDCQFNYEVNVNPKAFTETLIKNIFYLDGKNALNNLDSTIDMLTKVNLELANILTKIDIRSDHQQEGGEWYQRMSRDQVLENIKSTIKKELEYYLETLATLHHQIKTIENSSLDNQTEKIQLELSVAELGAVLRLFIESEIIKINTKSTKKALVEKISKYFVTKKGGGGSPEAISNAMYPSLDKSGFKFWSNILPQMQKESIKLSK